MIIKELQLSKIKQLCSKFIIIIVKYKTIVIFFLNVDSIRF